MILKLVKLVKVQQTTNVIFGQTEKNTKDAYPIHYNIVIYTQYI